MLRQLAELLHLRLWLLGSYACDEVAIPPAADTNLLRIPDSEPDEKWLFLSDILPTAWWANELANVQEGSVVAIWGSGPGTCSGHSPHSC